MDNIDTTKIPNIPNTLNGISTSELDSKTDYCLTNLKILSRMKVGDKVCFDDTARRFYIDEWSYTQPLTRWWGSEGRKPTIKSLEDFINSVFKTIDNIYTNEVSEPYADVQNTYYTNVTGTSNIFHEENSAILLSFINEMRNAIGGMGNLKQTYIDDVSTVSSLDIIIEKLNVRVKKIQSILQISKSDKSS
jgi:hypothetical protein